VLVVEGGPTSPPPGTPSGRVAVVMTMGALHEGHAELVRAARRAADHVVVTVFVNPLQFGAGEDLDRYPRTLAADLAVCEREGRDVVFTPTPDVVYPDGPPLVRVSAGPSATCSRAPAGRGTSTAS
jgi:pantoate--beta-alanine ligase